MAKVKYKAAEQTINGTHVVYAVPQPAGTLTFDELCDEACEDNTYSPEEMKGCVGRFMKTVQRQVQRGWRCSLGDHFLFIYPNLQLSVKDYTDKKTGELVVATAEMLNAQNGKSRLGCSVSPKFSQMFAQNVSWTRVDGQGNPTSEEDVTDNENPAGSGDNGGGDDLNPGENDG